MFRAAEAHGMELLELGGAVCLKLASVDNRLFNRVHGLRDAARLPEMAAFYGDTPFVVCDAFGVAPELERHGFARAYSWMRFVRGVDDLTASSELRVEAIGPAQAEDFGHV